MSRLRALVALAMFLLAVLVGLHARGASGGTLLAFGLGLVALDLAAPLLAGDHVRRVSIDEACELVTAEQRVQR